MPVALNHPAKNPFDNVVDVGVGLRLFQTPLASWQHAGVLYKINDGPARIFHLADHFDVRDDIPDQEWRWVQVSLPEISRRLVAELTKKIAERKDRLHFGFAYEEDIFSLEGEYLGQPTGMGLTCATVILAIFQRLGIQILKYDEWEKRPEDEVWQRGQVERLREKSLVLADRLAEHIGDPRFKPDEVAVGAASDRHPLGFKEAVKLAPRLARALEKSYTMRPPR